MPPAADNYCIRRDYTPNYQSRTLDTESEVFWGPTRIATSRDYQWHVYDRVTQIVRERGLRTVLDIGCGPATKLMSCIAPFATVYGIDQPSAVAYCKSTYPTGTFLVDDFEKPALQIDTKFDVVICSDVIEHIHDPDVLLNYIKRFCQRDTLVILSTPDRERLRGKNALTCTKPEHVREWSAPEFADYLRSRGFEVVDHLHLPPVRTAMNTLFLMHLFVQAARFRPYKYNQMTVCRLSRP